MNHLITAPGGKAPWKHISEIRDIGLKYIEDRRSGKIRSFKTPWNKLNNFLLQGLDWHSCLTCAGRPGTGKTVFLDMIAHQSHQHNKELDFAVLKFQFEVPEQSTGPREFAAATGLTIKQLYSADLGYKLADADIEKIRSYSQARKDDKVFQVSNAMTVKRMKETIYQFYNAMGKIPLIIGIDHTVLVKKGMDESGQLETMYALAQMVIEVKKDLPVIFIVLSQMNRELEKPERRNPGTIGNHPTSGDIFGSDALMQCSDVVLAMNRPNKLNIGIYGPYKIIVTPELIPVHLIKSRVSSEAIIFFKDNLKNFQLLEADKMPSQVTGADKLFTEENI
jgi:replicative DNA helicase